MGCYTFRANERPAGVLWAYDGELTLCTGRMEGQRPFLWARRIKRGLCPKCIGKVHLISPAMFSDDYDSMSMVYICEDCGMVFDWPHSYIAEIGIKIRVVGYPAWVTADLVKRFNEWESRGERDERGRFARNPLSEIKEG